MSEENGKTHPEPVFILSAGGLVITAGALAYGTTISPIHAIEGSCFVLQIWAVGIMATVAGVVLAYVRSRRISGRVFAFAHFALLIQVAVFFLP